MELKSNIPFLVKEQVTHIDEAAEVYLFGSRARGDADCNSDWDFLILLSQPQDYELIRVIRDNIYDIELATDEIITTIIEEKSNWEKFEETTIYRNISQEGLKVA